MHEISNSISLSRRQCLRLAMGMSSAALTFSGHTKPNTLRWRERLMVGLGTTLSLRAGHASAERADAGLDAAVKAIRHVEQHMSLFIPESTLCRLNRDGIVLHPDPDLVNVLSIAASVSARSHGAFDVTVQPIWNAWQSAKSMHRLPTPNELKIARDKTGWHNVEISAARIRFLKPNMALTLNGIAQGYASDLARDALRAQGIEHALIDTGEWRALGHGPESQPWSIGVENPRKLNALVARIMSDGRAVATSSDAHCSFSSDLKNHHIFDPKNSLLTQRHRLCHGIGRDLHFGRRFDQSHVYGGDQPCFSDSKKMASRCDCCCQVGAYTNQPSTQLFPNNLNKAFYCCLLNPGRSALRRSA